LPPSGDCLTSTNGRGSFSLPSLPDFPATCERPRTLIPPTSSEAGPRTFSWTRADIFSFFFHLRFLFPPRSPALECLLSPSNFPSRHCRLGPLPVILSPSLFPFLPPPSPRGSLPPPADSDPRLPCIRSIIRELKSSFFIQLLAPPLFSFVYPRIFALFSFASDFRAIGNSNSFFF